MKKMRLDAGLTQTQLGEVFERPHTFVHKVESGDRRIDPIEFARWCRTCGRDAGRILKQVVPK